MAPLVASAQDVAQPPQFKEEVKMATSELPRDIQSKLHDRIDEIGEKAARGDLVAIKGARQSETVTDGPRPSVNVCICKRYSDEADSGSVSFWNVQDPNCSYRHLQPLPQPHTIKLP